MPVAILNTKEKTQSDLHQFLTQESYFRIPKIGETIEGRVIHVSKREVHLDIDRMTTGVIRGGELVDESGEYSNLKIGDIAQATVIDLENENGEMELSFRHAGHRKAWDELEKFKKESAVVDAEIVDANKGGLLIRVRRVAGFLPVSQLIPEHYPRVEGGDKNRILERLATYIGQSFKVKVIDVDDKEEKLIVSEKAAWEEAQKDVLARYKIGEIIEGKVTGIVDFGAFVEFGEGLEGLVHISELAWQRIDDPRHHIKIGEKIRAMIIGMEGSKISLSIKKLIDDPWKKVSERYHIGKVVPGKVLKINLFGAFVELDPDIHGLVHISELSDQLIRDPSEVVKIGETYPFRILSIEPRDHRLGLSMKPDRSSSSKETESSVSPQTEADTPSNGESPANPS